MGARGVAHCRAARRRPTGRAYWRARTLNARQTRGLQGLCWAPLSFDTVASLKFGMWGSETTKRQNGVADEETETRLRPHFSRMLRPALIGA